MFFSWNKIISTTRAIAKNFLLAVNVSRMTNEQGESTESFETLMRFQRHYEALQIFTGNGSGKLCHSENLLFEVIERYGSNITDLTLGLDEGTEELVLRCLKCLPNLLELEIWQYSESNNIDKGFATPVLLKNLKELDVANDSILRLIETPALTRLEFKGNSKRDLQNFLYRSPKLDFLKVGANIKMNTDYPFKLETLSFRCYLHRGNIRNVKGFLLSQAASVKNLQAFSIGPTFHKIVLANFKQLEYFHTHLYTLGNFKNFCRTLSPMLHLKEIISELGFSRNRVVVRAILKRCPELVKLKCIQCDFLPSELEFIAKHNHKLEVLHLMFFKSTEAKFEILNELGLDQLKNVRALISFLKANPTIETLLIVHSRKNFKNRINDFNETNLKRALLCDRDWSFQRHSKLEWKRFYDERTLNISKVRLLNADGSRMFLSSEESDSEPESEQMEF